MNLTIRAPACCGLACAAKTLLASSLFLPGRTKSRALAHAAISACSTLNNESVSHSFGLRAP